MTEVAVSVIVPVYNAEKYLRDCLVSIGSQSLQDFECICIDDGSTDGSWTILEEFAAQDSRFFVSRSMNQGVSSARNKAIRQARGSYIAFVDSDDFVHPRFLEVMLADLQGSGLEVTSCRFWEVPENATYEACDFNVTAPCSLTRHDSFLASLAQSNAAIGVVVWNKLYRAEVVKKIMFDERLRAHEDDVFTLQVAGCVRSIMTNSARLVYHRNTSDSLSKHENQQWRHSFLQHWLEGVRILDELSPLEKRLLQKRTTRLLYRDLVKRPVRRAGADHRKVLSEGRETLVELRNDGMFLEKYLSIQERLIFMLVLSGCYQLAGLLLTSGVYNWRLYLAGQQAAGFHGSQVKNDG